MSFVKVFKELKDEYNRKKTEPQIDDAVQFTLYNSSKQIMEMVKKTPLNDEDLLNYISIRFNLSNVQAHAVLDFSKHVHDFPTQNYLRTVNKETGCKDIVTGIIKRATEVAEVACRMEGKTSVTDDDIIAQLPKIETWKVINTLSKQHEEKQNQDQSK